VLAEVAGYGLSADAYHATAPDPTGKGPLRAVRRALTEAGLGAEDVSYVNGHGTGTPTNDRMERKAMRSFFGSRVGQVPISSTKSALGHSLGASGAIEAVTCVLAIQNGVVPPTVNFQGDPPEDMDFIPNAGRPAGRRRHAVEQLRVRRQQLLAAAGAPGPPGPPRGGPAGAEGRRLRPRRRQRLRPRARRVARGRARRADGDRPDHRVRRREVRQRVRRRAVPAGRQAAGRRRPLAAPGPLRAPGAGATTFAFQDAGLRTHGPGRDDVGLVFATGYGPIETAVDLVLGMNTPAGASALSFANATVNAAAGAVCQALTLRGPTTTIASGGASALLALDCAMQLMRTGHTDRLVLLAIDDFCEAVVAERSRREPLAADGRLRPYDADRGGTVLGSAAVALLLETEEVVEARGGTAYARIEGVAHGGCTDGDEATAARVLRTLLSRTGTGAGEVDLLAGSGAGGERDVAELRALGTVFGPDLMVTAPKSLTGECEAASGGINLLTATLAVADGLVPGTANLERPLPDADVRHVTEPTPDAKVTRAVATAVTPGAVFGAALLAPVAG
jgi:3-oxoacyl-[acyl-carrier-protein] synthase II